jgi:hypothetical protein
MAWPAVVGGAGRAAEVGAVLAFAINAVPRIKPFGVGRLAG